MSKLKSKSISIPSPFDSTMHNTEWTCAALLANWINDITAQENISIGTATVEQREKSSGKRADISIPVSHRDSKLLCLIECKIPQWDVFNFDLKEDARQKALKRNAPYFGTCNFRKLILWDTEKAGNPNVIETAQIINKYDLSEIFDLDEIESYRYSEKIKKGITAFLKDVYGIYTGEIQEPKLPLDEYLIYRLHEKIKILTYHYTQIIYDQCHKDSRFAKALQRWFYEQGWEFPYPNVSESDYKKAARQTAYLLVNKILFYDVLQTKRPKQLDPLEIPSGLTKGSMLKKTLQNFFDEVLTIDYETIFETDFIDEIAFPEDEAVVTQIKELVIFLKKYDLGKIDYDIIGRVFERLIPADERHALGQYFTNADVVDVILSFCIHHENDKVLDPSCGTGTFLVRAYRYKKLLNQRIQHEDLLKSIWGNDIAKFPSHLATINLAIRDLASDANYPSILKEDFFELKVGNEGFENERWRKRMATNLGKDIREITYPRWFDAIVGNPPYTRQEEIPDIGVNKTDLIESALRFNNKQLAKLSKRAGIHAYFFVHAGKFLQDGKYLGFIVSNSWMDVDYGKGLQEYFLNNYKIVAIIGSKVERWFEEADVNTCIVILQKWKDEKERNKNLVRFVQLKKRLREFIPSAEDSWEKQQQRKRDINELRQTILGHDVLYENDDMRVYPITQEELWEEGYDKEIKKYGGAKWGKYLRAPDIFFKILLKGKDKLIKLGKIAKVKAGCYTGVNEFFYFDKRPDFKNKIEKDFLLQIIRSPRQIQSIYIDAKKVNTDVFSCHLTRTELKKQGEIALDYIKWGEKQSTKQRQKRDAGVLFPNVETVKGRSPGWWAIPENNLEPSNLFLLYVINKRFIAPYSKVKICSDRCFHRIFLHDESQLEIIATLLNSTLTNFFIELSGRSNLGLGALKFEASDAEKIFIINPNSIKKSIQKKLIDALVTNAQNPVADIFDSFGTTEPDNIEIDKIEKTRIEIDNIIFQDILGLSKQEQSEVYRSVLDLVKSRLEQANSVGKITKLKEGLDVEGFIEAAKNKLGDVRLGELYKQKILIQKNVKHVKLLPKATPLKVVKDMFDIKLTSGKSHILFNSEEEANYCKLFIEAGMDEIEIPETKVLQKILPELTEVAEQNRKQIAELIEPILNERLREQVENRLWREVMDH